MNKQMLEKTSHRPWALPSAPWVLYQEWHDLLFAHWRVPLDVLRPLIPSALEIDTFDGEAWLGVVPFRMAGIHPRRLMAVPWLSAFAELNVRTYVTDGQKQGVYFFSLDAANPVGVWLGRQWFHLPYFHADMHCRATSGGGIEYSSVRRSDAGVGFRARYRPSGTVYHSQPATLEHWLTERYCLYTANRRGQILRSEIHHAPWDLQPAEADITMNTMTLPAGITLPDEAPLLHFARAIRVVVWALNRV